MSEKLTDLQTRQKRFLTRILDRSCDTCKGNKRNSKGRRKCQIWQGVHDMNPMVYDNARKLFDLENRECKGYEPTSDAKL